MWPAKSKSNIPEAELTRPGHGEFDGVAAYYDYLMRKIPYGQWVDYVEAVLERFVHKPRTVLDLCCGTGKVGSEMLRRGYDVVGADLAEPMVRECAQRVPPLPAVVQDAAQLGFRAESFDLVVSLYDSLNYILQPERLVDCLRDAHAILKPRGMLVFDLNTPRALSTGLFTQENREDDERLQYSWKATWDHRKRLCRVDMWFSWNEDGTKEVFEETHWQYAYTTAEVTAMLREAGFTSVTAYDAFGFRPVTRWSDRAYHVARKE